VAPALSVVVVAHDMVRELPRTIRSLAPAYQRGIDAEAYEVIVVDNGSPEPLEPATLEQPDLKLRTVRVDPAHPSPARAANSGVQMAEGALIGLFIDGARLASPGLLAMASRAARMATRPLVATLGWHLGATRHIDAAGAGYDQAAEDELLAEADWERDGYRLFAVSTLAGSSARGWFGPLGESNALFMSSAMWTELGGLDERFVLPGGGLINHDLYRRACELAGSELIVLLGEGTFHQIHGGAATSGRYTRAEAGEEYKRLRGAPYAPPERPPLYLGSVPVTTLPALKRSVAWAEKAAAAGG
jgi:glycosyltransferase involved in cell wall biosynthesis